MVWEQLRRQIWRYVIVGSAIVLDSALAESLLLGGSWDLVSTVTSTLIGAISKYKYSFLIYNLSYKSHEPLSKSSSPKAVSAPKPLWKREVEGLLGYLNLPKPTFL